jgi:hypothetical protein
MVKGDCMTMKYAVNQVINNYPVGLVFYGTELKRDVVKLKPESKNCYVESVLRVARKVCREKFVCINMKTSKYRRV